jgi:hypothetical protein
MNSDGVMLDPACTYNMPRVQCHLNRNGTEWQHTDTGATGRP